jgi:hypothetical protein
MAALVVTVAIACTSGFCVGILIRIDNWTCFPDVSDRICCAQQAPFEDGEYWVVPEDEASDDSAAVSTARSSDGEGDAPSCISINFNAA